MDSSLQFSLIRMYSIWYCLQRYFICYLILIRKELIFSIIFFLQNGKKVVRLCRMARSLFVKAAVTGYENHALMKFSDLFFSYEH